MSTRTVRPGYDRGKCHICEDTVEIRFCKVCKHWFCDICSYRIAARAMSAFAELKKKLTFGEPTTGCCGPTPPESDAVEA